MKSTYIEKVKLIGGTTYRVGEEQDISLQPRYLDRRILETSSWTAHDGM
jgi:hypothetical protein